MQSKPSPIFIFGAGAGTGKTYALTSEFADAVVGRGRYPHPIAADRIVATTFTNLAADELRSRVRQRLIRDNHNDAANAVLDGYIGTVNSLCGRLINEFGIFAGIPPANDVISEDRILPAFSVAVESVLQEHESALRDCADNLGFENWKEVVFEITQTARVNDLSHEDLQSSAAKSWQELSQFFDDPSDSLDIDQMLSELLKSTAERLSASNDGKKVTADALATIENSCREFASKGSVGWEDWARLSKLKASAQLDFLLEPVRILAASHIKHPRLRNDLHRFIVTTFECASKALNEYETYKRKRGFVDFIDQEQLGLQILTCDRSRKYVAEQFSLLLVDEFQDTSPLQLAIFLELSKLVDQSVWVGDEKQAIFGFRGCDPLLIQEVTRKVVPMSGGKRVQQKINYRSCSELVHFVDDAFEHILLKTGIADDTCRLTASRTALRSGKEAINAWSLGGGDWSQSLQALAQSIQMALEDPTLYPVMDKISGLWRGPKGSDVAIICRSNERRRQVAQALAKLGIAVDTERPGLLKAGEVELAMAALRYFVDPADTLAIAESCRIRSQDDAWLSELVTDDRDALRARCQELSDLDGLRWRLKDLTPREALEIAIEVGGVQKYAKRLGNVPRRLMNLDSLRGLARGYEDRCRAERRSCSPSGLIRFFDEIDQPRQPGVSSEHAVRVLTYHKSKGLEWPLTILLDLQAAEKGDAFGIHALSAESGFNVFEPLKSRWIRFWPWPYGRQRRNVILDERIATSSAAVDANQKALAESVRLLYVGMTRAQDYLILASRTSPEGKRWLDLLTDADGTQILINQPANGKMTVASPNLRHEHSIQIQTLNSWKEPKAPIQATVTYGPESKIWSASFMPFRIAASSVSEPLHPLRIAQCLDVGDRLACNFGSDHELFGTALHQFLAVDDAQANRTDRMSSAGQILSLFKLSLDNVEHFITASDRLFRFIHDRFPGGSMRREIPIHGRIELQRMTGYLDMLIELDRRLVIIDHKTFPGRQGSLKKRLRQYFPQMSVYKNVAEAATGKPVHEIWIHLPVLGKFAQFDVAQDSQGG